MKAIQIEQFGELDVLEYKEDIARPEPSEGEVLIHIHAAGVNPVDTLIRRGLLQKVAHYTLPLILGWDVAGVVEAVGTGVNSFKVGDEVYAMTGMMPAGGYAEYVALPAANVALKPRSLTFIQAASVPLVSLTALQGLFDIAELSPGQTVLIHAASGGVGSFAVQLAKLRGARVIGTASAANQEFVKSLGADVVIDYRSTPFETVAHDVDVVLDLVGGDTQARSWQVLKPGGILASTVTPPEKPEASNARGAYVGAQPNGEQLKQIAELLDAGKVKTFVEIVLPLQEARRAQELTQNGHPQGKIVLQINADN